MINRHPHASECSAGNCDWSTCYRDLLECVLLMCVIVRVGAVLSISKRLLKDSYQVDTDAYHPTTSYQKSTRKDFLWILPYHAWMSFEHRECHSCFRAALHKSVMEPTSVIQRRIAASRVGQKPYPVESIFKSWIYFTSLFACLWEDFCCLD